MQMTSKRVIKFLASLKLAVVIMVVLAILVAVGTIIESKYDANAAAKLIYKTPWMYAVLGALVVSLTAVMVDRWPWQKKHIPFVLAHIGIIVMLAGSLITALWGLDGSMIFPIGQKNRFVQVPETTLTVWSSFDGDRYAKIHEAEVDFFLNQPTQKKPYLVSLGSESGGGELKITDYMPYALASRRIVEARQQGLGAGLRFQLKNAQTEFSEWLLQRKAGESVSTAAGLAAITLGVPTTVSEPNNELFVWPNEKVGKNNTEKLNYLIRYKDGRKSVRGTIRVGQAVATGWMGLEFTVVQYFSKAEEKWDFKKLESPTPISTSAIEIEYQQKKHWVQLNDLLKLFTDQAVFIVTYANKRIDLGFDILLKKFEMDTYQGTARAATYQSLVETPDGETLISMNEPLKYKGLTFYQASFQQDQMGRPTASVLSVNHDPGRFLKYLGSLILSIGTVWLFYNRRQKKKVAV